MSLAFTDTASNEELLLEKSISKSHFGSVSMGKQRGHNKNPNENKIANLQILVHNLISVRNLE